MRNSGTNNMWSSHLMKWRLFIRMRVVTWRTITLLVNEWKMLMMNGKMIQHISDSRWWLRKQANITALQVYCHQYDSTNKTQRNQPTIIIKEDWMKHKYVEQQCAHVCKEHAKKHALTNVEVKEETLMRSMMLCWMNKSTKWNPKKQTNKPIANTTQDNTTPEKTIQTPSDELTIM